MTDQATKDFTNIFEEMDIKYHIMHVKWTEGRHFEIKIHTELASDSEDSNRLCDNWMESFSAKTNTIWVHKLSNTGAKTKIRKQYQCWNQESKIVKKELLFDTRRCKGTLDVKILMDNPNVKYKNKMKRIGFNALVKINFSHLHQVNTEETNAFFIHKCQPQPEIKPVPVSSSFTTLLNKQKLEADSKATTTSKNIDDILVRGNEFEVNTNVESISNLNCVSSNMSKLCLNSQQLSTNENNLSSNINHMTPNGNHLSLNINHMTPNATDSLHGSNQLLIDNNKLPLDNIELTDKLHLDKNYLPLDNNISSNKELPSEYKNISSNINKSSTNTNQSLPIIKSSSDIDVSTMVDSSFQTSKNHTNKSISNVLLDSEQSTNNTHNIMEQGNQSSINNFFCIANQLSTNSIQLSSTKNHLPNFTDKFSGLSQTNLIPNSSPVNSVSGDCNNLTLGLDTSNVNQLPKDTQFLPHFSSNSEIINPDSSLNELPTIGVPNDNESSVYTTVKNNLGQITDQPTNISYNIISSPIEKSAPTEQSDLPTYQSTNYLVSSSPTIYSVSFPLTHYSVSTITHPVPKVVEPLSLIPFPVYEQVNPFPASVMIRPVLQNIRTIPLGSAQTLKSTDSELLAKDEQNFNTSTLTQIYEAHTNTMNETEYELNELNKNESEHIENLNETKINSNESKLNNKGNENEKTNSKKGMNKEAKEFGIQTRKMTKNDNNVKNGQEHKITNAKIGVSKIKNQVTLTKKLKKNYQKKNGSCKQLKPNKTLENKSLSSISLANNCYNVVDQGETFITGPMSNNISTSDDGIDKVNSPLTNILEINSAKTNTKTVHNSNFIDTNIDCNEPAKVASADYLLASNDGNVTQNECSSISDEALSHGNKLNENNSVKKKIKIVNSIKILPEKKRTLIHSEDCVTLHIKVRENGDLTHEDNPSRPLHPNKIKKLYDQPVVSLPCISTPGNKYLSFDKSNKLR